MSEERRDLWLTIPNVICLFRLFGSLLLIPVVLAERADLALTLFVALACTDWFDGKLARWFDQRSRIGPKLDSLADVTMYAMLLFAVLWLRTEIFLQELPWLLIAASMFLVACTIPLIKFGTLPSYHTRSAKVSWFLTAVAAISLFLNWSVWPLRIAVVSVLMANLESIVITAILSRPRTDVISFRTARRLEKEEKEQGNSS